MKKLLLVALPVGAVLVAVVLLLGRQRAAADGYEARIERARLKREFGERAGALRMLPPDRAAEWRDEVLALSRWYFDRLQAVRNRHPGEPPRPSALEGAEAERRKPFKPEERAQFEDFQRYAESRLALLREGRYAPVATALAGSVRLDLVAIEPGPSPQGGPGLRLDFALWGAPRYQEREEGREGAVTRTVVPIALRSMAFRLLDGKGKLYGEMTGSGEPYQKLVDPERFVDDFPPGALFGTWWIELLPRESATVRMELLAEVRGATGIGHPVTFEVALPVAEAWKLPPGATFEAQVREAAPEPASAR
jgi:hypothetical protein